MNPRRFSCAVLVAVLLVTAFGCSHIVVLHDPLTAPEHNDLGVAYESGGRADLAAREYRRALKLDPNFARAWVNLGNLDAAAGRWPKAETHYRHALRAQPDDADALNNLAITLMRQRRDMDEARRLSERAVAVGGARDSIYRATLEEIRAAER